MIVSDDVGMHAMDGLLDKPETIARFMAAGNDMMMICSHWTDNERARAFARALIEGEKAGLVPGDALAASRERVRLMLSRTPQHQVQPLHDSEFARHRQAGALFSEATVEVV